MFATYDNSVDQSTGTFYPNMCDKNYLNGSTKRPSNFDEHMFKTTLATNSYKTHVLVNYKGLHYIPLEQINKIPIKYLYIINTFNVNFK